MKVYATKAELLSESKGIKTYKITWVDSNNNENIDIDSVEAKQIELLIKQFKTKER